MRTVPTTSTGTQTTIHHLHSIHHKSLEYDERYKNCRV